MNIGTYAKEGSTCSLTPNSNGLANGTSIPAEIESITSDYVEIRVDQPKKWMYNKESQHQSFKVVCYLKTQSGNSTEERSTRPTIGGGTYDDYIYGGGITVVNSNDIRVKDVSATWKQPPMTYDVSKYFCIKYNFFIS